MDGHSDTTGMVARATSSDDVQVVIDLRDDGATSPVGLPAPGWRPDPTGRYVDRWWDGGRWTAQVRWGDDQRAEDPVSRPWGAAGPATTAYTDMPTGGGSRSVRVAVVVGLLLPLTLVVMAARHATVWIEDVRDGVRTVTCERVPGLDGDCDTTSSP